MWYNIKVMSENNKSKKTVHHVLAHSYLLYFIALILGLILDFIYPLSFSIASFFTYAGLVFVIAGSILVIWAQRSSGHLRRKKEEVHHTDFKKGPYFFIRTPTQLGLSFLVFGYGLLANSFFISIGAILAHTVSQLVFIPRAERFLEESYGEHYLHYKKTVKRI